VAALCGRRIGAVEVSASAECSGALLGAPIISVLRCLACELEGSVQWPGQVGGRPAASLSYTAAMGGGGVPEIARRAAQPKIARCGPPPRAAGPPIRLTLSLRLAHGVRVCALCVCLCLLHTIEGALQENRRSRSECLSTREHVDGPR